MVLADLGRRLTTAFRDLQGSSPIDEKQFDSTLKEICAALLESDVNVRLVQTLRKSIKHKVDFKNLPAGTNRKRYIAKAVFDELVALVDTHEKPYEPKPKKTNVIMLVGLQGAGKTTTCTKLALYYQRRGFKSCLVCADTFRAGAFDQLKQNAIKARIPFFGSYTETDPAVIAAQGVERFKKEKYSVIIVDTSGRHRQEEELFKEMVEIGRAVNPDSTIMILDASIGQAAEAQSKAFKESSDFGSIIITKMDGHAKGGGAISAVAATHTPISFIGTGEHMYDLERFSPRPFISKLLGMGDMATLMDQVKTMNFDKNKEMVKHLEQGIFTIRDMRDQLNSIMKLGPLSKLAGNIPGMAAMFQNAGSDEDGNPQMRRMMYMMDSMTEKGDILDPITYSLSIVNMIELDSDGKCFVSEPTRLTRVARGSGTSVRELEELLSQHRTFAQMAKKMGGKGGMMQKIAKGGGPPKNAAQAAALQKKLQKQAAAGGGGGGGGQMAQAMKMFKDMWGGGGGDMPDMAAMQDMMSKMGMGGGMGGMGRGGGRP